MSMGTTISVILIAVSMIFVLLQRYMSRRNVYHGYLINKPVKIRLRGWRNVLAHVVVYAIALCGALPVIVSVIYSSAHQRPVFKDGSPSRAMSASSSTWRRSALLAQLWGLVGAADRHRRHAGRPLVRAAPRYLPRCSTAPS